MRFDLTQAAYRVFDRASRVRLPSGLAAIDAAKLLTALFEEEETRAADWLTEAGLSLNAFRTAFGLIDETATLDSPISAPAFPMGNYGVSPGQPQAVEFGPPNPELAAASGDAPPQSADVPDRAIVDQWTETASKPKPQRAAYSIHSDYPTESGNSNHGEPIHFFLDEQPVRIGRLSKELESTLWILIHRFGQGSSGNEFRTMPNLRFGLSNVPLATEHLLLAAALDEGEVGRWLHDNGLDPTELFEKIEKLSVGKTQDSDFEPPQTGSTDHGLQTTSRLTSHASRLHRLLDAVSNRASEALRVVEDYVRFVLDDKTLTAKLKDFRHELRQLLKPFSNTEQRDTEQDVGTELEGGGEYERREASDVLSANFGRLQESLRSLEEFSKLETPQSAKEFERLRYRSYTLHKEVLAESPFSHAEGDNNSPFSSQESDSSLFSHVEGDNNSPLSLRERVRVRGNPQRSRLASAKLYALTDCGTDAAGFQEKIRTLIADGADIIQLRDKTADDRTLLERAKILRELTNVSERAVLFVMNDRPDLARLAEADGVHVGQEELSVQDVRSIVGGAMLIGASTHNIDQARAAVRDGADYLGAGPVFPSATKNFETFPGLKFLREVAAEIRIPVFAIGGIDADNLPQVFETGITRIAVGRAPLASLIY